ncbi:MAG: prepilin peptidase, partial [Kiritimatiellia bacterium]
MFAILPASLWYPFCSALAFCWGACIGSFLNVCIYRIPREESVVHPGSHCPACNAPIKWYQNIPIFAWLALRGRCAACKVKISPRYIGVEFLTACLFLLAWLKFDVYSGSRFLALDPVTSLGLIPVYWLVIMGLVLGTFVDFDHMIIPDRVTLGGMVCGVLASLL